MFESLKKKLKGLFSTEDKPKSTKKSKVKKSKPKKSNNKKPSKVKKSKQSIEQNLKEKSENIQDEVPTEFNPGTLKYEPDTEQLEENIAKEEKKGFFSFLTGKITSAKITQEQFDQFFYELELILLEHNVALEAVDKIRERLQKKLIGSEIKKSELEKTITNSLKESINELLREPQDLITQIKNKDGIFVILFFGINGSGKTTSVAKLAHYLKKNKISCVLAAGDTFRAASIEQLETHASRLGLPIIKQTYGADPAAVAFDARKYAEKNHIKCVLIDTAGRMYTRENLMKEMEKIVRVSQPDLKLFVGESITGNDATEQARTFNETVGIDGIILTKADVDEKGGTALSVSEVTGKPIYFLGQGQNYDDLVPFKKKDVLKHLGID